MLGICHLVIRGFIVVKNRSQGINQNQPVGKINEIHICIYIHIYIHIYIYIYIALQVNIIPLPVNINRKIKKTTVKLNFRRSQ